MAFISGGILVLMWILGHDFSGHYNRLTLVPVDIISGVYCTAGYKSHWILWPLKAGPDAATISGVDCIA